MFGTEFVSKIFQTCEEKAASWWDRTLRAPTTLTGLGKTLSGVSLVKERWDRNLETAWGAWRLPSALDVERLHERLGELEDHICELNLQLETSLAAQAQAAAPTAKETSNDGASA